MKIYIKITHEVEVTEDELKEIQDNPSWKLLRTLMDKAKMYSVPEIITEDQLKIE